MKNSAPQDFDAWGDLLALLIEGLVREARADLREAIARTGATLSDEIGSAGESVARARAALSDEMGGVREDVAETGARLASEVGSVGESVARSQRDFARLGRELVRSGAALESLQASVAAIGPAIEEIAASSPAELARDLARERSLREAAERAALDDLLAAIDGLELNIEAGYYLTETLAPQPDRPLGPEAVTPEPPPPWQAGEPPPAVERSGAHEPPAPRWWHVIGAALGLTPRRKDDRGLPPAQDVPDTPAVMISAAPPPPEARATPALPATPVAEPAFGAALAGVEHLVEGLELTRRRLLDALARRGIRPIEAQGMPFDPYLHEAVGVEPCPAELDGIVLREQRRGYRTPERIVRLAQVIVGRATLRNNLIT
ncbi:MAG: nucleotide exchange factor GrpE [Chloroflexi bacterium]|nr:nucleotide exchange factor GrpE [Chloroflexota bacterium]